MNNDSTTVKISMFMDKMLDNLNDINIEYIDYVIPNDGVGTTITHIILEYQKKLEIKYTLDGIYMCLKGYVETSEILISKDEYSNVLYQRMVMLLTSEVIAYKVKYYLINRGMVVENYE